MQTESCDRVGFCLLPLRRPAWLRILRGAGNTSVANVGSVTNVNNSMTVLDISMLTTGVTGTGSLNIQDSILRQNSSFRPRRAQRSRCLC